VPLGAWGAPAPGTPTDLIADLSARYDISSSVSVTTDDGTYSTSFTGSDSGISYSVS
jgi:hypothetical protein